MIRIILPLLLPAILVISASAQDQQPTTLRDTINADRPDQAESPHIVPKGHLQAEAGLTLNPFDSAGHQPAPLIGMLTLRYGISWRLEVRAMAEDGRGRDRFLGETTQGAFPLAVGWKYLILERETGPVPQIAMSAWVQLPFTARTAGERNYWSPQVQVDFENQLGKRLELESNVGIKQNGFGPDWQEMVNVALHLKLTGRLVMFGEYYGQYEHGSSPMHNADGGLMYLVSPSVQLDVSAGHTLGATHGQANDFVMVGASALLP